MADESEGSPEVGAEGSADQGSTGADGADRDPDPGSDHDDAVEAEEPYGPFPDPTREDATADGDTGESDATDDGTESENGNGGLRKVDPDGEEGSGGLRKVESDGEDDDSGGLRKVDPDDQDDSGGLRKVEDDRVEEFRRRHRPESESGEYGPHPPGESRRPDPDFGPPEEDDPPVGHASGASTPGDGGSSAASTPGETPGGNVPGDVSGTFDPGTPEEPPDDEEMPLADHIEEMVSRLMVVIVVVALATALTFPLAEDVLLTMWEGLLPERAGDPYLYGPLEKILAELKLASLAGLLIALPVLVYQSYRFMRPGLYPRERRYYLAAVPTSLVLGVIGMAFAYFLILPWLFEYFIIYSEDGVDQLAFGLEVTFELIVSMLAAFAIVFQIPMLIMLAIMMGVTSREWLESKRIYFWGGFLGLGFLMGGADLTGMAPIVIAATMVGLFEGTLALLRWTGR